MRTNVIHYWEEPNTPGEVYFIVYVSFTDGEFFMTETSSLNAAKERVNDFLCQKVGNSNIQYKKFEGKEHDNYYDYTLGCPFTLPLGMSYLPP